MKAESLKWCSIYSPVSTTQGVEHLCDLCGDIAYMHDDTYIRMPLACLRCRAWHDAPTAKLCSWPKTASFSSSLHFGQWGAHSCKRPGFDAAPTLPFPSTELICWLTKCDYPQPFIMLLVRRVTGRNIWRNQLIPSYLGTTIHQNNSCTILCHS